MSLAADTSPSLRACRHCALTFPSPRDLDRHVALDHTPDADGAQIVALITAPRAPSGPTGRPAPVLTASAGSPPGASTETSPPWWRVTWGQALIASYGLLTLFAAAPLLAMTLAVLGLLVVAYTARHRLAAWASPSPPGPQAPGRASAAPPSPEPPSPEPPPARPRD